MAGAIAVVALGALVLPVGIENATTGLPGGLGAIGLALVVAVPIVAGAIEGTIGFGYGMIATPIFAVLIDPTTAVVALAVPPWMINAFQVGETNTGAAYVRRHWPLLALAVLGTIGGVAFLAVYETSPAITLLLGVLMVSYVGFELLNGGRVVEGVDRPVVLNTSGLCHGFLLAVSNLGPLLPAYFHAFERDSDRYVGGLSMVFVVVFSVRIIAMGITGIMTLPDLWLGSVLAVLTSVGVLAGTYVRRLGFDEDRLERVVLAVLLLIGLNLLRKTLPQVLP
jgi:uncharacterized protein